MQKWEYMILVAHSEYYDFGVGIVSKLNNKEIKDWSKKKWEIGAALTQLGEEGWELVNVSWLNATETNRVIEMVYYFKRPKIN